MLAQGVHQRKKVTRLRTLSIAFGGAFPNITEAILDDENSTKVRI